MKKSVIIKKLKRVKKKYSDIISTKDQLIKDQEGDNESLIFQLHKTQEEVERFVLKQKDLIVENETLKIEANELRSQIKKIAKNTTLTGVIIDFTIDGLDGENWYDIEPNGRWAGPELTSTIILPPLIEGSYEMHIYITDVMEMTMIDSLNIMINHYLLPPVKKKNNNFMRFKKTEKKLPTIIKRIFDTNKLPKKDQYTLSLTVKNVVSPTDVGWNKDDFRKLSIMLSAIKITKIA